MSGYIPNPDDASQPTVGRPAQSAAAEFRALKAKVNSLGSPLATLDPSDTGPFLTLSGGNTIVTVTRVGGIPPATFPFGISLARGTLGIYQTKTYFEVTILRMERPIYIGVQTLLNDLVHAPGVAAGSGQSINRAGVNYDPDVNTFSHSYGFNNNDILGVAVDVLGQSISFYLNNVLLETKTNIVFGSSGQAVYPVVGLSGYLDSVQVNFGAAAFAYTPPGGYTGFGSIFSYVSGIRNLIVNGRCEIDQRNSGNPQFLIANAAYMTDHWRFNSTVAGKFDAQRDHSSVVPPPGYSHSQGLAVAVAYTPLDTDAFYVSQFIEGFDFSRLAYGTPEAKTSTLLFYARSSLVGPHSGSLTNSSSTRTYPFTFFITAANVWQKFAIIIPGDTTGTWNGANNAKSAVLRFNLGSGHDFLGVANSWVNGSTVGVANSVVTVANLFSTFHFTGVELKDGVFVAGSTPEVIPYGVEIDRCLRYYRKAACFIPTVGTFQTTFMFSPRMRDTPTITGAGPGFATPAISDQLVQMEQTVASSQILEFNAEMT